MNSFENLQSQWQNQPETTPSNKDFDAILDRIGAIKKKQKITGIVLFATIAILVFFFFYISGYKNKEVTIGLIVMVLSLVTRIGIEILSLRKLKNINVTLPGVGFKEQLTKYYANRKLVHYVITPLIVLAYIIGFIMLLPAFKVTLSAGFYTYIIVSSIVILLVLGTFIGVQIRKELEKLRSLNATA